MQRQGRVLYNSSWQGGRAACIHNTHNTHKAPAARLASRSVKLATGEQSNSETLLGKGEGEKATERRRKRDRLEMEMMGAVEKEQLGHDRLEEEEQHRGRKTRLRALKESGNKRAEEYGGVGEGAREDGRCWRDQGERGSRGRGGVRGGGVYMALKAKGVRWPSLMSWKTTTRFTPSAGFTLQLLLVQSQPDMLPFSQSFGSCQS